jgi:predicted lipase
LGGEEKIDNIIVCGHSLGGAVTTLFAYSIYTTYKSDKIISCTIGSPRVGNKVFKTNFDKSPIKSLRIVNNLDVVTRTPNIGYHHVNTELRIDDEGKIKKWMVDWQRVSEYLKAVFTGKTAKDHMTANYISALNKWNP